MNKRRSNGARRAPGSQGVKLPIGAGVASGETLRAAALGWIAATLVVTQLLPCDSNSVQTGTGVILVLSWLALLAACVLYRWFRGGAVVRVNGLDAGVVALLVWFAASALMTATDNNVRVLINTTWQWISLGVSYLVVKQLVRQPAERRALAGLMIALAVGLSAFGFYQYFHSMPRDRELFHADPDAMMREAGVYAPEGSPLRKQFQDRVDSTEPMASFALTNSLASYLSTWFVVLVGMGVVLLGQRPRRPGVWLALVLAGLLIAGCLVLTKSRTAYLATAFGMVLIAAVHADVWKRRIGWKLPALAAVMFVLVLAGAMAVGGLDRLVLSEAPKSLLYRFEYWQATLGMIADHPVFGVGPGTYQEHYTAYKLPQASETVLEPHNFAFEVAAIAGLPALLALLGVLIAAAWQWRSLRHEPPRSDAVPENEPDLGALPAKSGLHAILWGAAAGALVSVPVQSLVDYRLDLAGVGVTLLVTAATLALLYPWLRQGTLRGTALAIGLVVLLVNLLASGGIGFPGVAQSFWLLLALAWHIELFPHRRWNLSKNSLSGAVLGATLLFLAFLATEYLPVVRGTAVLSEAQSRAMLGDAAGAERLYRKAAAVDPYSADPWRQLAALRHQVWLQTKSADAQQAFHEAAQEMLRRLPHSHQAHRMYGNWLLASYHAIQDRSLVVDATEAFEKAVQLYPNDNFGRAQLAWAYHLAGAAERAAAEADEALRLNRLNPHIEQHLSQRQIDDPLARALAPDAEQLMQLLRTSKGIP